MKQLINGQQGYVNLYLNDYYSLKETLFSLQSQVIKQDSILSRNNMSCDQSNYDQLSDFQQFSINNSSNASFRNQTDISYISTTQSLINFSTATTEAPKKLATAINHHQSEIIYILCRRSEKKMELKEDIILKYIKQNIDSNENKPLIDNLLQEIGALFFQTKNKQLISTKFKQWKNTSRHFGPSSSQAISILDAIITESQTKQSHSQILTADLKKIKQQLTLHQQSLEISLTQMGYYRSMGHFHNYAASFINFIRYQISIKDKKSAYNVESMFQTAEILAKNLLFIMKNAEKSIYQTIKILNLINNYFKDKRLLIYSKLQKVQCFVQVCYLYLCSRNALNFEDLACYISYLCIESQQNNKKIKMLIKKLQEFAQKNKEDIRLKVYLYHVSFKFASKFPSYINKLQKLLKSIIQSMQISNSREKTVMLIELMILFLKIKDYNKIFQINEQVIIGLNNSKDMLINWNYYNIVRLKIIGECYIESDSKKSQELYLQALRLTQQNYGNYTRAEDIFDIINNLCFIYNQRKEYKTSMKYLYDMKDILQQADRWALVDKKIYVYQQIVIIKLSILGIQSQQDIEESIKLIKLAISQIFKFAIPNSTCKFNQIIGGLNNQKIDTKDRYQIQKQIIKFMCKQQRYKLAFMNMYLNLNLSVSKYLIKQMKMRQLGMKYLWNYIEIKNSTPRLITQEDYQVFNVFASLLIKSNAFRRAIIFMKKYIFKIPVNYFTVKKNAFQLMYKACSSIEEKIGKVYYELTRNNFSLLISKEFTSLIGKQKSVYKKFLLKKWLQKI